MNNFFLGFLGAVVGVIVGVAAALLFIHPGTVQTVSSTIGAAAQGSAPAAFATPSVSTTTFASFFNNDGNDRVITAVKMYLPKEMSTQTVTFATSSSPITISGNTVGTFALATTSNPTYYATTTAFASDLNRIWKAGTYLNFINSLTIEASSTGGVIQIEYLQL